MTTDAPKDPPLEAMESGGCYEAVVVSLDDVRIRQGRTRYGVKICKHHRLIYNQTERRVWCEDCERTIDNFDAFMLFTQKFESMERAARFKLATADEALKSAARLRATKELDRMWSGKRMAPCCPHCRHALLPDDFANGVSAVSYEIEVKRRDTNSSA